MYRNTKITSNSVTIGQTRSARVDSSVVHQVSPAARSGVLAGGPPIGVAVHCEKGLTSRGWVRLQQVFRQKTGSYTFDVDPELNDLPHHNMKRTQEEEGPVR